MTPFRSALDALAALSVPGVAANYGIDSLPESLTRAHLPALLVLPLETATTRLAFDPAGGAFEALAFAQSAREITYHVTHLLLSAPAAAGSGLRTHLPGLIDHIDTYFTVLAADVTLGGRLAAPARVRVEPGLFSYDGVRFVGCALRHEWHINVRS